MLKCLKSELFTKSIRVELKGGLTLGFSFVRESESLTCHVLKLQLLNTMFWC